MNIDITDLQSLLFYDVKNPFNADGFEGLDIHISKYRVNATIYFKNGNTSGNHYIEAHDIKELNEKLNDFFAAMNSMT